LCSERAVGDSQPDRVVSESIVSISIDELIPGDDARDGIARKRAGAGADELESPEPEQPRRPIALT
jgi:hypothetical protein